MSKIKVLYVSQEITPYVPESEMSTLGRFLPQRMMEKGMEIRTFMPRFGKINTRRHQLHEVIRLSGMNLVVNDVDHPLIIKVASHSACQNAGVPLLTTKEYFQRKAFLTDEIGEAFPDNDERSIFFVKRGTGNGKEIRLVSRYYSLSWMDDLFITRLSLKQHIKTIHYSMKAKIVYTAFSDIPNGDLDKDLKAKLKFDNIDDEYLKYLDTVTYDGLHKTALDLSGCYCCW